MRRRNLMMATIFVAAFAVLSVTSLVLEQVVAAQNGGGTVRAPRFEVDPFWPKPLPNNERGAELNPPTGECCKGAPPVLEFDANGNLVGSWGGPGAGYQWPQSN